METIIRSVGRPCIHWHIRGNTSCQRVRRHGLSPRFEDSGSERVWVCVKRMKISVRISSGLCLLLIYNKPVAYFCVVFVCVSEVDWELSLLPEDSLCAFGRCWEYKAIYSARVLHPGPRLPVCWEVWAEFDLFSFAKKRDCHQLVLVTQSLPKLLVVL